MNFRTINRLAAHAVFIAMILFTLACQVARLVPTAIEHPIEMTIVAIGAVLVIVWLLLSSGILSEGDDDE